MSQEPYLKIDKETARNLLSLPLNEKWEMFNSICNDEEKKEEVRKGVKEVFYIEDVIAGEPFIKIKAKRGVVIIRNKIMGINNFRDEMNKRKEKMNKLLLQASQWDTDQRTSNDNNISHKFLREDGESF